MPKIKNSPNVDGPIEAGEMGELVQSFQWGLPILMPLGDRPHEYLLYAGCVLRDHFEHPNVRLSMNIHGFTTNFWRASNAVIEAIAIHQREENAKQAIYLIMPGDVDGCEKAIMHQVRMLTQDFTPEYTYIVLALFRQPMTQPQYPAITRIHGSQLHHVGDYQVDPSETPNYRLYICGWGMTYGSLDLEPYN